MPPDEQSMTSIPFPLRVFATRSFGQELVHKITMRAVQLQHVEARLTGALRGMAPRLYEIFDLKALQRLRHRPFLAVRDCARRHGRPRVPVVDLGRPRQRPVALPGTPGACLAAGMTELDSSGRVLLLDKPHQALQRLNKFIVPDSEIAYGAAAAPLDLCRLDDHEARAAGCEFSGVHQMPVGRKSLDR